MAFYFGPTRAMERNVCMRFSQVLVFGEEMVK